MLTGEGRPRSATQLWSSKPRPMPPFSRGWQGRPRPPPHARTSHVAFVTLRLVDLLGPEPAPLPAGAFQYQLAATERCCRDLPGDSTETAHLAGLLLAAT